MVSVNRVKKALTAPLSDKSITSNKLLLEVIIVYAFTLGVSQGLAQP